MKDKTKIEKCTFVVIWLFLCCYFLQVFNFPNKLTVLIGVVFCLGMFVNQRKIRLDLETGLLILSLFSYFIILYGVDALTMSLPYVGVLIYILSHYLTCEILGREENYEKYFMWFLYALVAGYSLHGILNSYLFVDGQLNGWEWIRVWLDIWGGWYLPGTWQVIFFLPMLSMIFPAIIYFKKNKYLNLTILLVSVCFFYVSFASQTRTPIFVFLLVFFAQMALYAIVERDTVEKIVKTPAFFISVLVVILSAIIIVFLYRNNPLMESIKSVLGRDGGIFNNIRFKIQREGLKQLFVYPMGGYQMHFLGHPHAHNTWIDIADAAGVIPFFLFASYTFLTIYELIVWLFKKEISVERKLMVFGLYGSFFLYYTIERGLGGSMHYMTPWFFINAMVHGELSSMKKNKI